MIANTDPRQVQVRVQRPPPPPPKPQQPPAYGGVRGQPSAVPPSKESHFDPMAQPPPASGPPPTSGPPPMLPPFLPGMLPPGMKLPPPPKPGEPLTEEQQKAMTLMMEQMQKFQQQHTANGPMPAAPLPMSGFAKSGTGIADSQRAQGQMPGSRMLPTHASQTGAVPLRTSAIPGAMRGQMPMAGQMLGQSQMHSHRMHATMPMATTVTSGQITMMAPPPPSAFPMKKRTNQYKCWPVEDECFHCEWHPLGWPIDASHPHKWPLPMASGFASMNAGGGGMMAASAMPGARMAATGAAAMGGAMIGMSATTATVSTTQGAVLPGADLSKLSDEHSLFVFHLPDFVDSASLLQLFMPYGAVRAKVAKHETGQSRGFGFVYTTSKHYAQIAIEMMNGYQIGRKKLRVSFKRDESTQTAAEKS